jgi:SHS2 domain-containing protein
VTDDPPRAGWRHFDHDADMGIAGSGPTAAEAFEQAALGMTAIVTSAPVRAEQRVAVTCKAPDLELLLVDWLNALIYEMSVGHWLFGRFAVSIEPRRDDGFELEGTAWGEPVDRARHHPAVEIKGATLTGVAVAQDSRGQWHARCVVDV